MRQLRWARGHRLFAGDVELDSKTRCAGLRRAGLPYLGPGQHIRARALLPAQPGWTLVLRRVRPAGPVVSGPVPLAAGAVGRERGWIGIAVLDAVTTGFVLLLAGPSTLRRIHREADHHGNPRGRAAVRTGMQRLLLPLLAGVALTAAVAAGQTHIASARADCAPAVVWHGGLYLGGFGRHAHARAGAPLGRGTLPGCNDTGGPSAPSTPVGLRRVAGVDQRIAVWTGGRVYVADGYFPQLPGFPAVHRRSGGSRSCRSRVAVRVLARVQPAGVGMLSATLLRPLPQLGWSAGRRLGADAVLVDSKTRFVGLDRAGRPYLGSGQRISARAIACRHGDGWVLVLRRVRPAGPIAGGPVRLDGDPGGVPAGNLGDDGGNGGQGWFGAALAAAAIAAVALALGGPPALRALRR